MLEAYHHSVCITSNCSIYRDIHNAKTSTAILAVKVVDLYTDMSSSDRDLSKGFLEYNSWGKWCYTVSLYCQDKFDNLRLASWMYNFHWLSLYFRLTPSETFTQNVILSYNTYCSNYSTLSSPLEIYSFAPKRKRILHVYLLIHAHKRVVEWL